MRSDNASCLVALLYSSAIMREGWCDAAISLYSIIIWLSYFNVIYSVVIKMLINLICGSNWIMTLRRAGTSAPATGDCKQQCCVSARLPASLWSAILIQTTSMNKRKRLWGNWLHCAMAAGYNRVWKQPWNQFGSPVWVGMSKGDHTVPSDKMSHTCMAWAEPLIVLVSCQLTWLQAVSLARALKWLGQIHLLMWWCACGRGPEYSGKSLVMCLFSLNIVPECRWRSVVEAQCYVVQ